MRSRPRGSIDPTCPFCGAALDRPESIDAGDAERVLGGFCKGCGAIYIVDQTGKNAGEAMVQALGIAAERLRKSPSDLMPGDDYEDAILSYDWRTHRSPGISKGFRDGFGRLYIVRVKQQAA